ncbi:hypothetical protein IAT38_005904 [Cryptococcus sp. DSM 104549]
MAETIQLATLSFTGQTNTTTADADPHSDTASIHSIHSTTSETKKIQELQEKHLQGIEPNEAHHALARVDGGLQAWLFLVSATFMTVLVWGMPFSIGILHLYWTNTLFDGTGEATVTLTATLHSGLLYFSSAIFGPLMTAYPKWMKRLQCFGLLSAVIAMPWHLLITMGCVYPISGAYYLPCATLLFEWFHAKRGLATGIVYAGTGIGGTIFPFIMQGLISNIGYKLAMISLGVGYGVLGAIALIPIKRRIPISRFEAGDGDIGEARKSKKMDLSYMWSVPMAAAAATLLVISFGNFIPSIWLPSYAEDLHFTSPSGTGLIALLNASSVPGNLFLGYLSDRIHLRYVMLISCVGSAMACAFLWGFGTSEAMLIAFAVVYGLLGPSFAALWTKLIQVISGDDPVAPALIFSVFSVIRGVGNVTSGPISEALLKLDILQGASGAYGRNNYGVLLIYSAVTIASGGITSMWFKG